MDLPDMKLYTPPGGPDPQEMMKLMFGADGKLKIYVAPADEHAVVMAYTSLDRLKAALEFYKSNQPGLLGDAGVAKVAAALPPGSQAVAYASLGGVAKVAQQFATMLPGGRATTIPDFPDSPPLGIAVKVSPSGAEGHLVVTAETLRAIGDVVAKARGEAPRAGQSQQPAALDMKKAEAEVESKYAKAHPEIKAYVDWTVRSFGPDGMWLNEDAFAGLPDDVRENKIRSLAKLLEEGEYGRHLCPGLAEASALKDKRLVAGLMKVASYHRENFDYDCRAKWMAVAALSRQESDDSVPLLISMVDHGNQNTRMWARAALSRITGQDFKQDKQAWAKWWKMKGHAPIDDALLKPWEATAPSK
jgi:hypothetical protein